MAVWRPEKALHTIIILHFITLPSKSFNNMVSSYYSAMHDSIKRSLGSTLQYLMHIYTNVMRTMRSDHLPTHEWTL